MYAFRAENHKYLVSVLAHGTAFCTNLLPSERPCKCFKITGTLPIPVTSNIKQICVRISAEMIDGELYPPGRRVETCRGLEHSRAANNTL